MYETILCRFKVMVVSACLGIFFSSAFAQSSPCNPTVFNSNTVGCQNNYSVSDGTIDIQPSCNANVVPIVEHWFEFTPSSAGPYSLEVSGQGGGNDIGLAIYEGTPVAGGGGSCDVSDMTVIICQNANSGGGDPEEIIPIELQAGTTYYIQTFKPDGNNNSISPDLCIDALPYTHTSTCSASFTDAGGAGGNYSNNTNQVWIFCSDDVSFPYISVDFTSFLLESGPYDYLTVYDGDGFNNTVLGVYNSNDNPGQITSSTGCLTFYLTSDISITESGWEALITCTDIPGVLPDPTISDCLGAVGLCADQDVNVTGSQTGNYTDLSESNQGCLNGEHNSIWIFVKVADADGDGDPGTVGTGTLGMELTYPNQYEYDYAIWGPLEGTSPEDFCTPYLPPSRCSFSPNTGNSNTTVGMDGVTDTDQVYEGNATSEDGWIFWYDNVQNGDVYLVLIDEFTGGQHDYTLNFTGTASTGGGLDCSVSSPLPINLISQEAFEYRDGNRIEWVTGSEINNDYFLVEKSYNGYNWHPLSTIEGAGTTNTVQTYSTFDHNAREGITYYRISQFDFNGNKETFDVLSVNRDFSDFISELIPNPSANGSFSFVYQGKKQSELIISIVDAQGKIILEEKRFVKRGHEIDIIVPLNQGVYFVHFQDENTHLLKRLVVTQ